MANTFLGFQRENGSVGVRNYVGVLSAMDNVNPVTRAICNQVRGTVPVTTLFVRGQFGKDEEITVRTLIGLGSNPNLAACLVIGLEPVTTLRLVDEIAKTGKAVDYVLLQQEGGSIEAMAKGVRKAARMAISVSREQRRPFSFEHLVLGVECGASDTTSGCASNPAIGVVADRVVDAGGRVVISETAEFLGAEHLFARRAINEQIGEKILAAVRNLEENALQRGVDIRGANPVADNIRGGLTTIEEKALGAMVKSGTRPVQDVIDYSVPPTGPGVFFMDTPAPAVESLTGLAGGGCQVTMFSTGVGNPIGHPVSVTIKISGNINTIERFSDNVDGDVSGILAQGESVAAAGERMTQLLLDVSSGMMTTSEALYQLENGISRFERTI